MSSILSAATPAVAVCCKTIKMKRFLGLVYILIVIIVLLSAVCLSTGARTWLRGDADNDGAITSIDVTTVQRVVAGVITDDDGAIAIRCDMDGDGLSLPDATAIQRSLAGLPTVFHVGETVNDDIYEPTVDDELPILKQ